MECIPTIRMAENKTGKSQGEHEHISQTYLQRSVITLLSAKVKSLSCCYCEFPTTNCCCRQQRLMNWIWVSLSLDLGPFLVVGDDTDRDTRWNCVRMPWVMVMGNEKLVVFNLLLNTQTYLSLKTKAFTAEANIQM